jgi:DNA repair exonuclease SbcCD ATPase subunit
MKNEIKVILTADIKNLQSALGKAQQALQEFEAKNAADTEKSNTAKKRQLGIIEKLNKEAEKLKVSITRATSKEDIAKFNGELEQTRKKLSELNALGKSSSTPVGLINNLNAQLKTLKQSIASATDEKDVARLNAELRNTQQELQRISALGKNITAPAVKSFTQLKSSVGAANGSAIAFNRIIQDAPFGLLGVGNNIQQFTEQISFLKQTTGSTGNALKSFFGSLFTSTNLLILGVSAVTAALTAYQMGAFDSAEETRDLAKELEDFKESLDGVTKGQLDGAQSAQKQIQAFELLRLQAENLGLSDEKRLLAVKKLKEEFPDLLKGYTDEEILLGKVGKAYEEITKQLNAFATAQSLSSIVGENKAKVIALEFQEQKRALEILKERALLEKATSGVSQTSALKVAGQFTAGDIEETRIKERITKLELEQAESANKRQEILRENLFINKRVSEEIAKANGLIDASVDPLKEINRELNYYELIQDRVNQKTDIQKNLLEDLAQKQINLFREVRELQQKPINFVNVANLIAAEEKLKAIDEIIGPLESKFKDIQIEIDPTKLEGLESPTTPDIQEPGKIEGLENQIASLEKLKRVTSDPVALALYAFQIANLKNQLAELNGEEVKSNLELVADAFGSLASGIAASLNISNRALRGFVTTLISATPKIISAIGLQADAKRSASTKNVISDKKEAIAGGISLGTKAAEALGPVGLALLPVFIAGAVALISGAFSKIGGGGGGGSVSAGQGSTFGNRREFGGPVSKGRAYIVGEKRPELFVPNTNGIIVPQLPSMDYSGASMSAGAMAVDVNIRGVSYGDDILFTVQQAEIRRGLR